MTDIAIIGLACRFPGANNQQQLWKNLLNGESAISIPPNDRKYLLHNGSLQAGFIDNYAGFDENFFGISPREAKYMDPQQRLLLQIVWQAVADAGMDMQSLSGKDVGVYVGIMSSDWGRVLFTDQRLIESHSGTGNGYCMVANRISYTFNFKGPSLAIDTACSSSLVAVDYACKALRNNDIDLAIVGGVNLILSDSLNEFYKKAGLNSAANKCQPFGSKADGIVRGEGIGAVVLKRSDAARASANRCYAHIKGFAANHNGKSNGISAPSRKAQANVIHRAIQSAAIKPEDIYYVETHGTGTKIGDPIEANALADAISQHKLKDNDKLLIGSIKSNIGHLEGAAGVAGLIKAVLAMHYKIIPASLHFHGGNQYIDFTSKRLALVETNLKIAHQKQPIYFGISSFGLGGTNAHVIIGSDQTNQQHYQALSIKTQLTSTAKKITLDVPAYQFSERQYPIEQHLQPAPAVNHKHSSDSLEKKIKKFVSEICEIKTDAINLESCFINDLAFDSLMFVDLYSKINKQIFHDKKHEPLDFMKINRVGELITAIQQQLGGQLHA